MKEKAFDVFVLNTFILG